MALTLTEYRTKVLDLLDDLSSLRFTTQQLDAAIQQALFMYNRARPVVRTYMLDTTGYQVLDLPADFEASMITRVQLYNDTSHAAQYDVIFKASKINEGWQIETCGAIYAEGQVLTVTYSAKNTIDGLDGAAGTTIDDDYLLALGAAGYACQSRAVSRSETINMQPSVHAQLQASGQEYLTRFVIGLRSSTGMAMQGF